MNRLDFFVARNVYKLYYSTYPNIFHLYMYSIQNYFQTYVKQILTIYSLSLAQKCRLHVLESAAHVRHWYIDNFRQPIANMVRDGADQSRTGANWRQLAWSTDDSRKSLDQTVAFWRALLQSGKTLTPIRGRGPPDGYFGASALQLPQKSDEPFRISDKLRLVGVNWTQTFHV